MPVRLLMMPLLLALLALSACEDKQVAGPQGEKGDQGPPGPAGPGPGPGTSPDARNPFSPKKTRFLLGVRKVMRVVLLGVRFFSSPGGAAVNSQGRKPLERRVRQESPRISDDPASRRATARRDAGSSNQKLN